MIAAAGLDAAPRLVWALPFVVLLAAIAVLPVLKRTAAWWHHNSNKLLISVVLATITLIYYQSRPGGVSTADGLIDAGWATLSHVLHHALLDEYFPFITLLFALYVICGGIVVRGDIRALPSVNTLILGIGGVLASLIGTTGASMVLIRLLLKTNSERRNVVHTIVFFIIIVSNVGGSLLPTGDPPLYLGYLRGVPFFWTLRLVGPWAVSLVLLVGCYYLMDRRAYRRETHSAIRRDTKTGEPIRLAGCGNIAWLILALLVVVLLAPGQAIPGLGFTAPPYAREAALLGVAGLAWFATPARLRRENEFNFAPIAEVAVLFLGIFITMQPSIEILHAAAPQIAAVGVLRPWHFFWGTGILSSALDNAPTYVVFFETADRLTSAGGPGVLELVTGDFMRADYLAAISCGAVFMGANTYIGNGPNFMVKAMAENAGIRMPSFVGYLRYSLPILTPLYVILTLFFFL